MFGLKIQPNKTLSNTYSSLLGYNIREFCLQAQKEPGDLRIHKESDDFRVLGELVIDFEYLGNKMIYQKRIYEYKGKRSKYTWLVTSISYKLKSDSGIVLGICCYNNKFVVPLNSTKFEVVQA